MIRAVIGAVFLALAMVPGAAGAQVGLRDDLAATEVALAGPDVLVLRELREGSAELVAMSRTGAAARTLLSVESARPACCTGETLAASEARLAVIVAVAGRRRPDRRADRAWARNCEPRRARARAARFEGPDAAALHRRRHRRGG